LAQITRGEFLRLAAGAAAALGVGGPAHAAPGLNTRVIPKSGENCRSSASAPRAPSMSVMVRRRALRWPR